MRAPRTGREAERSLELEAAFSERAQRGEPAAVVGVERRRFARKCRPAHDVASRRSRTRAQLHHRRNGIRRQLFEQQLARREHDPGRDDIHVAANARVRAGFTKRRGDRDQFERQRAAGCGREHPPVRFHPRGVRRTADDAGARAERRAQPAERAGQRSRAGPEQQHERRRGRARRRRHVGGPVDRGERRGASARVAGIAAG
jgi:hypothetical protein